jgi:lipoyl(octanoyl) transferase
LNFGCGAVPEVFRRFRDSSFPSNGCSSDMSLEIIPMRTAGAAENMAIDFLLLQRYPNANAPRFRHYNWRLPAFTFGYGQKIDFVREQLPRGQSFDLCRRPTGGGIVDHREDWTYALVIPRGHPLEELRATITYRAVHESIAEALKTLGVSAAIELDKDPIEEAATGVCFERAELYDVIDLQSGRKIAGAAQKRNKHGLLLQGSVARSAVTPKDFDWDQFEERFVTHLASALNEELASTPWPDFDEDELSGLTEAIRYSSRIRFERGAGEHAVARLRRG